MEELSWSSFLINHLWLPWDYFVSTSGWNNLLNNHKALKRKLIFFSISYFLCTDIQSIYFSGVIFPSFRQVTLQRWHIAYFIWCWFPTDDKCSNANLLNVRYQIDLSWSICFYPALLTVDHHTADWIDEVVVWGWMWPGSPDWLLCGFCFLDKDSVSWNSI